MKKIVSTLCVVLIAVSGAFAQYRFDPLVWTMEVLFNPITTSTNSIELTTYGVKGRLFFNESWCMRIQLGFDNNSTEAKSFVDNSSDNWTKTVKSTTMFTFFPGFEYHFAGNDRLSPYIGGDLGFGLYNHHNKVTSSENSNKAVTEGTNYLMGINAVTGVDIFLYQGLYLGVEISLGFNNLRENSTRNDVTVCGTTSASKPKDYTHVSQFGFNCVPSLRLGCSF